MSLVWQSVSHPHVIPAKAQPRGGIFALKVGKAESKCEDSSTPLRSARNDTELALRRVGNGFIRSVCGMHKCIPYITCCHWLAMTASTKLNDSENGKICIKICKKVYNLGSLCYTICALCETMQKIRNFWQPMAA